MLRQQALDALTLSDVNAKLQAVELMLLNSRLDIAAAYIPLLPIPGRSLRPVLVPPTAVPRRSLRTLEGRAALIHSLAHIEFNAINLALDIIWRFAGMPEAFYRDWLKVAQEEASHFSLLNQHLQTLGFTYGDFAAHDGLWLMAEKTADDLLARLALVPRTLEARGLDVNVPMRNKLQQAGDNAAAAILDLILRDEITHVAIGNRWYDYLCAQRQLSPQDCYRQLLLQYQAAPLRGPFNLEARLAAGFSAEELQALMVSTAEGK